MIGGNSKLDPVVEKCFLEAVEKTNLPREDTVCVEICDKCKSMLGGPGSGVRRDMQECWENLKRRKIRSCARYLKGKSVAKGEATARLCRSDSCTAQVGVNFRLK